MIEKALELLKQLIHHVDFVPITIFIGAVITIIGTVIALIGGLGWIGVTISFGLFLIFFAWIVDNTV